MTEIARKLAIEAGLPETLAFVRHAESQRNADPYAATFKKLPDRLVQLTETGVWQAEASAAPLRDYLGPFHAVRRSPYKRAIHTSRLLLAGYSPDEIAAMDIDDDDLLIERDAGSLYGKTPEEAETEFPGIHRQLLQAGAFRAMPPGGESLQQASFRAKRFLSEKLSRHAGKKLLVVTHEGMIRCFRFCLEGWTPARFDRECRYNAPKNCGVTAYFFSPHSRRLELSFYNKSFV